MLIFVLDDVCELYFATTILCNTFKLSNSQDQKYIELNLMHFDKKALNLLQPVILCLETFLKVHAREAGIYLRIEVLGQQIVEV